MIKYGKFLPHCHCLYGLFLLKQKKNVKKLDVTTNLLPWLLQFGDQNKKPTAFRFLTASSWLLNCRDHSCQSFSLLVQMLGTVIVTKPVSPDTSSWLDQFAPGCPAKAAVCLGQYWDRMSEACICKTTSCFLTCPGVLRWMTCQREEGCRGRNCRARAG